MAQAEKMAMLTNLLTHTSWDAARMARRRVLELIGTGIIFASAGLYGVYLVLQHLPSGDWWNYLFFGCTGIVTIFAYFVGIITLQYEWAERQKMRAAALALRAAAEERSGALAPLAAVQPSPLSTEELAAGPQRFALSGRWKDSASASVGIGMLLLLIGAGLTVIFVLVIVQNQWDAPLPGTGTVLLGIFLIIGFIFLDSMGLAFLARSWGQPWHAYVVTDEHGLRWWRPGWHHLRPALLEWQAAKSFFVIAYAGAGKIKGCKVYVLDGHDCLYLWRLSAALPDEKRAMIERFNRVVAARSGLPLRDLSAAAAQVARIVGRPGEV